MSSTVEFAPRIVVNVADGTLSVVAGWDREPNPKMSGPKTFCSLQARSRSLDMFIAISESELNVVLDSQPCTTSVNVFRFTDWRFAEDRTCPTSTRLRMPVAAIRGMARGRLVTWHLHQRHASCRKRPAENAPISSRPPNAELCVQTKVDLQSPLFVGGTGRHWQFALEFWTQNELIRSRNELSTSTRLYLGLRFVVVGAACGELNTSSIEKRAKVWVAGSVLRRGAHKSRSRTAQLLQWLCKLSFPGQLPQAGILRSDAGALLHLVVLGTYVLCALREGISAKSGHFCAAVEHAKKQAAKLKGNGPSRQDLLRFPGFAGPQSS